MNLGIQIIERVRELHNLGFIHLDIKPSNIMADRREDSGNAKLKCFLIIIINHMTNY